MTGRPGVIIGAIAVVGHRVAIGTAGRKGPRRSSAVGRCRRESGDVRGLVFAGGCFWGVQGVFQHVKVVTGAVSGYDCS